MALISFVSSGESNRHPKLTNPERLRAEAERFDQLKQIAKFSSSGYVLPLFLLFNLADWYYYEHFAWEFLSYRLATVVGIFVLNKIIQRVNTLFVGQILCTIFILFCAVPLYMMVCKIGDSGSPYYAGLILVMIGMSSGFRFTWPFYVLNFCLITFPMIWLIPLTLDIQRSSFYFLNVLFLFSTGLIQMVSRIFNEKLHFKEYRSRLDLENEITNRDQVIKEKSQEAISLALLSKQFSPQVVHAITSGELDINRPVHRSDICVLFVDIVNSTERFLKLDREDLHSILTMYMDDVMSSLLKFDITIDKFMGDGILAFSNDPIRHADYIERMLYAALEIREKIEARQARYSELWMAEFQISIGIAAGFASVGFYGSSLHLKSYTAIGPVVNLAARLGSAAEPQQILVSNDVIRKLEKRNSEILNKFTFNSRGVVRLKGFETDLVQVSELKGMAEAEPAISTVKGNPPVCINGHGLLFLDTNERGIFVFKCRTCGHVAEEEKKAA